VVRARKVGQVEGGVAVHVACAEGANQLALRRWDETEASVVAAGAVTARRVEIGIVKRARVGVNNKRGGNITIGIPIGRWTTRCTWTRRRGLGCVPSTVTAGTAAARVMSGTFANYI
jgi:hypothetical protein